MTTHIGSRCSRAELYQHWASRPSLEQGDCNQRVEESTTLPLPHFVVRHHARTNSRVVKHSPKSHVLPEVRLRFYAEHDNMKRERGTANDQSCNGCSNVCQTRF